MNRPTAASALAGALLALAFALPVLAHAELVSSDPEHRAILAEPPAAVTLTFSEAVDPGKSRFKLIGPDGAVGTGKVGDDRKVIVLDGLHLTPGAYEIQWTVASDDGHLERGKLRFTVAEPSASAGTATPTPETPLPPTATTGVTGEPATLVPPTQTLDRASPAPVTAPDTTAGAGGDVLLPIVAGLILVGAVGAFVLRRSRRA